MDYTKIAQNFVDQFFPDAQGALLSGSAVTGEMTPTSDLDLLVFYNDIHSHYRKLYEYNGQKVEAMVHRISECRETFEADRKRRNKAFLDLVKKGTIIKDTDQIVAALQSEAQNIYDQGPPPFTPYEKELHYYIINNRLEDFIDNEDYHESYFIFSNLLYFLTKVLLVSQGQWANKGEGKWQLRAIQEFDQALSKELTAAIDDFCQHRKKEKIFALTRKALALLSPENSAGYEAGIPPAFNKVRKWFLIDLYYAEPHEELLADLIKPVFKYLQENAYVAQMFFTRNYKNGSHISLYLATDKTTFEERVVPYVEEAISQYISLNPSLRITPDIYKHLPKKFQLFPNNAIQYHHFEVDLLKYMGSEGLDVFEQQFKASSDFVLDLISAEPQTDFNQKLGEVIKINWAMLYTLGLSPEQLILFFSTYWDSWGTYQFSPLPGPFIFNDKVNHTSTLTQKQEEALHQNFEQKYLQQKEQMPGFLQDLWETLEAQGRLETDQRLNDYLAHLRQVKQKLEELHRQQHLFLPHASATALADYPLWFFYREFLHATNNRLGILYENERYITFLMQRCASEICLITQGQSMSF